MPDYNPPPGPPPSYNTSNSNNQDYAPPPGPPPSKKFSSNNPFNPFRRNKDKPTPEEYAPPPGPPPSQQQQPPHDYAPPPGPPPSQGKQEVWQHAPSQGQSWETAVPDTALLPPPPAFFASLESSMINNATGDECAAGEFWCSRNPLFPPHQLTQPDRNNLSMGNINLFAPPWFKGTLTPAGVGRWNVQATGKTKDFTLTSWPPLYNHYLHYPPVINQSKRIYYEVKIHSKNPSKEIDLALGFTAPPYPPERLPGWHRGSLAVHGDDGSRFVNDNKGGQSFVQPFQRGDTVGLGMDFSRGAGGHGVAVTCFFTRNGRVEGKWDLYEERDAEQGEMPLDGLKGDRDLCAAVGVFNPTTIDIVFTPGDWAWKGFHGEQL